VSAGARVYRTTCRTWHAHSEPRPIMGEGGARMVPEEKGRSHRNRTVLLDSCQNL